MARSLSFTTIKEILPFAVILVSVTFWGAGIVTQQALTNQKLDYVVSNQQHLNGQMDSLTTQYNDLANKHGRQDERITQLERITAPLLSSSR